MGLSGWVRTHRRVVGAAGVVVALMLAFGLYWFQPWKLVTRNTVDEALPAGLAGPAVSSLATSLTGATVVTVPSLPTGASVDPTTVPSATTATTVRSATTATTVPSATTATTVPSATTTATVAEPPTEAAAPWPATEPAVATASPATSSPPPAVPPVIVAPPAPAEPTVLGSGAFVDGEHSTSGSATLLQLPDGSRYLRLAGFSTSDGPDVRVALTDQAAGGEWGSFDDGRYVELGRLKGTDGNQNYEIAADVDLSGLRSAVIWCERFSVAFGSAELAA